MNKNTLIVLGMLAAGMYYFGIFRSRRSYLRWEKQKKVPDSSYGYAQVDESGPSQEMYI